MLEPGVERIIDHKAVTDLLVVIFEHLRQSQRHGEQTVDFELPDGKVRGVLSGLPSFEGLRVVPRPAHAFRGPAERMIASEDYARAIGATVRADGGFELDHVSSGAQLLEVRDGARVIASREVTVRGTVDIGDWRIAR